MNKQNWRSSYLRLHPLAALKRLELPYIYHIGSDELFEIDDKAQMFMARCNGSYMGAELTSDAEFAEYCLKEGLLEALPHPDHITVSVDHAPEPSLRYLEIELLHRCNLKCRHCYLDQSCQEELSLDDAIKIAKEFASNGGLRLLISGGEPLLYPHLKDFLAETSGLKLRRVLLTNGTLITEDNTAWLKVENIQFSLDGWRQGHDLLRGKGNFERTIQGINAARQAGIPVSIATMIHKGNINEFERMESFVREIGATEWGIDVPCVTGSLKLNNDLIVPRERGASLMKFAFGGSYHGPSDGFACGRHLMTVLPTGRAVKCGFYEADSLGDAREGLIDCWLRLKHIPLDALECKGCPVVNECAGGCRFRAPHPFAPDPVMCAFYGICGECKG